MTSQFLAGVDEVGRGSLAGPVISVAIILKDSLDRSLMIDSKKLTHKKRLFLAQYILQNCWSIGVGEKTNLDLQPKIAYIDGIYKPKIDIECESFIKGDDRIPEISAASIVAKVLRDNEMMVLDKKLPVYGFMKHKGYGTREHIEALKIFGPSIYHRFSFAPLKKS